MFSVSFFFQIKVFHEAEFKRPIDFAHKFLEHESEVAIY